MMEFRTKLCPRCGEELFDDMCVCYGCLFDFSKEGARPRPRPPERFSRSASGNEGEKGDDSAPPSWGLPELVEEAPYGWDRGLPPAEFDWEDDTIDLSATPNPSLSSVMHVSAWIRTPSLDVRLPLPEGGLMVGRDAANDIVLHSRAVSRAHVRLVPAQGGILAIDQGATNPALFRGREVGDGTLIPLGGTLSVCGAYITAMPTAEKCRNSQDQWK
jgi:hypothetical protein